MYFLISKKGDTVFGLCNFLPSGRWGWLSHCLTHIFLWSPAHIGYRFSTGGLCIPKDHATTKWPISELTHDLSPHQSAQLTMWNTTDHSQRRFRHTQYFLTYWDILLTKINNAQEECRCISLLQVSRAAFSSYIGAWKSLLITISLWRL